MVWVVEVETPWEDLDITPPPAPPGVPAMRQWITASQALGATYLNAAVNAIQQHVTRDIYKMYWSACDGTKNTFTSKRAAQVAVAKAVLQDKKARMYERRDNDFSGWKR